MFGAGFRPRYLSVDKVNAMVRTKNEAAQYNGITGGRDLAAAFDLLLSNFTWNLLQQLYNTADAMIVGKFVGKEALSAVGGTTGTLINLLVGFFVGVSSGASVVVSQYYGAKQDRYVKIAVHTSLCVAILAAWRF